MQSSKYLYIAVKRTHDKLYPWLRRFSAVRKAKEMFLNYFESRIESIDEEPESIFEKSDWDNLIILDACRYDLYCEVTGKEPDYRITLGSTTMEYIERTFSDGKFEDIVYIAANPFFYDEYLKEKIGNSNPFHEKYNVFQSSWSEEHGTVLPKSVLRDAKSASKLFPTKKLIIHFIQPHYPFIDQKIGKNFNSFDKWFNGESSSRNVWQRAERGEINKEKVWEGYRKNLELVVEPVEELLGELEGKTVITSDHGNLVGEGNRFGHPNNRDFKVLRKVPWDVAKEG